MNNLKRRYFELWADEEAQNLILKWILIFALLIILVETTSLCVLALRPATLVALGQKSTQVLTLEKPKPEQLRGELERLVEKYVFTHYTWDYSSIENAHREASKYVADVFQKAFLQANSDQVKQVKEKKISQVVYKSKSTEIDPSKLTAKVYLDRIFTVDNLKGTAPLTLEITFEYGSRTESNPEGIYITNEKLIPPDESQKK